MPSELLRQVQLVDPVSQSAEGTSQASLVDVLITDGWIVAIAPQINTYPDDTEIFDRPGLVLGTGLVDLYSHSSEPGHESRETLASLLEAAIAGGFTRLAILPDTHPPLDNPGAVNWLQRTIAQHSAKSGSLPIQVHLWGALTQAMQGQQLSELADLLDAGVVGLVADSASIALLQRSLDYLQGWQPAIALSCCDPTLTRNGIVREGVEALRLGLPGTPAIAETTTLSAILECIATTQTPVHLMRISTARSVELIRAAKSEGLPITASTTWLHLLLDITDLQHYSPSLHLSPPLGNPEDRLALRQAVKTGVIDAIAIDHTPYTYEEKTVAFAEAPPGTVGLELALPLLWQALITSGQWDIVSLWSALSTNPSLCLQQTPAAIAPGNPAELTLFDPQEIWTVNDQTLKTCDRTSYWLDKSITGKVIKTWSPQAIANR